MADAGIVRSRAKIAAAIGNARAYLAMRDAGEAFAPFVWSFVDGCRGAARARWSAPHPGTHCPWR